MISLHTKTEELLKDYEWLPVGLGCECPYFNNRRRGTRGSFRALVGKGLPKEIAEEAVLCGLREKVDVKNLSSEQLKSLLINHDLGVDCSGLVYHLLDSESRAKGKGVLARHIHTKGNFWRRFVSSIRKAENTGAATLAHDNNSSPIRHEDILPGDMIFLLGTGPEKNYNHVMLVRSVTKEKGDVRVEYAHSYSWPSDGRTGHGVRRGTIVFTRDLFEGVWTEKGKTGEDNYTYWIAKSASISEVRRLNIFG